MENLLEIVNSVSNILKSENIIEIDGIIHCIFFIFTTYITEQKCIEFNIPIEFAFENFLKDKKGNTIIDNIIIFKKFINTDTSKPSLIRYIQEKLHINLFSIKIQSSINFINIYKILTKFNKQDISFTDDIVGIVYQYFINKSNTINKREIGQYFTNRQIIKFMIQLCNPKLKANGEIETILDPSCGSGGFLALSYKYLNDNNSNINWDINKKNIFGFDTSSLFTNLSAFNLFIESGKIFIDAIKVNDTLCNDYKINSSTTRA